ncbi:hypothetical protein H6F90_11880 [Trichocoleus sp. FACHB-591]|uniref:hypothetical protein n=1 Tax=Trichocoleus sp. FACHB-591 TaxID=2692872 RepID=UPI001684F43B|nr:hypothetical protein [Trichocoleus sp. FACHB-591]MBD2095848.1 hypothetical protein [Trichocoleus sp. FACHB-591]
MTNSFKLETREEVELFERRLNEYMISTVGTSTWPISLVTAYDQMQGRNDLGHVFAALIDLYLSFILVSADSMKIAGIWNEISSKGNLESGSALDSPEIFFGKMEVHRYSTSYVLRYRALWDKIMGFLVRLLAPDQYDKFFSAKSRKKEFKNIALKIQEIPDELVEQISVFVTLFDDSFRTAEAHGTGTLRKYSFLMEPVQENPQIQLLGYWNFVNEMVTQMGGYLKNLKSLAPFEPIKLIRLGNYISMEKPKRIQEYAQDLQQNGVLLKCSIIASTILALEYLRKLKPRTESLYIPNLAEYFEGVAIRRLPDFFNDRFWLSSARLILNYCKSWELDPEILLGAQLVVVSPRGTMHPDQIKTVADAKDFMIGIAAATAAHEIGQKLNFSNSSAEELERLLFFRGAPLCRIVLPDSPTNSSNTLQDPSTN